MSSSMRSVQRLIRSPAEIVWSVLADGWLYPVWVVGASRMREVDASWPQPSARIHHSVGVWPGLINDYTEVTESVPPQRLVLRARVWPAGEAEVRLEIEPHETASLVKMSERVSGGPGRLLPGPLEGFGLRWRNTESLRRLAFIAEGKNPSPRPSPAT